MAAPIYVLGHRNPDSDSVCAAIGYAALMREKGCPEAVAARQGVLRRETAYVLERFGVPAPMLVTDVRPRVGDVMTSPPVTVHEGTSLREVGRLLHHQSIRTVPVVDDQGRLRGVMGIEDFARAFVADLDLDQLDYVKLDLESVLRALDGEVLVRAPERALRDRVMVGAMRIDSMLKRLEPGILLVMGDREDAQRAAIELGVGALVVTGDVPVVPEVIELARERRVTLVKVPHHTYATVRLIYLSTPVRYVMRTEVPTCRTDDLVEDVREQIRSGATRSLVVTREDGTIAGLISRSNLLKTVRRRVVLIDHNERGQSVAGIDEAEVVGVVDHHRVADFHTDTAPYMRLEPVGSTSTIVVKLFAEADIQVSRAIAGVLLAGILADTLLFHGPTTTPEDQRVAADLAGRADVDMQELGTRILDLASDVSDRSAEQLLEADFKDFSVDDHHFGIGTIETTNAADVLARREELKRAMARLSQRGYSCVLFAVVDILHEQTTLLVEGQEDIVAEAFDAVSHDHTIELPTILSRKKHIVPRLGFISSRMQRR